MPLFILGISWHVINYESVLDFLKVQGFTLLSMSSFEYDNQIRPVEYFHRKIQNKGDIKENI